MDPAGIFLTDTLEHPFGAGTFDASVVRRTGTGFEVLATVGLPDAGGLDIDTAIVAYLAATYAQHAEEWRRLTQPASPGDRFASPEMAARFQEEIPDSELQVFDDAGHFVWEDDPQGTTRALVDFLERRVA